ncbi:MAG: hypothetical protein C0582_02010 [Alphaproteobacteria bacterium]|nr:MAG: hypothetical protein C0582_02010 [Alphaproteobacteria bacterium]
MKLVYINGRYSRHDAAEISINDRAVVFGDALYESIAVHEGCLFDYQRHLDRLYAGMTSLKMQPYMAQSSVKVPVANLLQKEGIKQGLLYIQVSRGVYPRAHAIPKHGKGSLFMYFKKMPTFVENREIGVWLASDPRSAYCQHKATALLPNILSKQDVIDKGGDEVVFIRDDRIIEAASANVFLVKAGTLYTCPENQAIVPGVTRERLLNRARHLGMDVVLQAPKMDWIEQADEMFTSHASNAISHITHVNGQKIPTKRAVSEKLFGDYFRTCPRHCLIR